MEYQSNSHKSKEAAKQNEGRKAEKVIHGSAKVVKKNEFQKFAEVFISKDAKNVGTYLAEDVLIPAFKKMVSEAFKNGIDIILYGEARGSSSNSSANRYWNSSQINTSRSYDSNRRVSRVRGYDFDDIELDTRGDAEEVLTEMEFSIKEYGNISVAEYYDLVGVTSSHADYNYGWTDLRAATVARTRNGKYVLELPKAISIR